MTNVTTKNNKMVELSEEQLNCIAGGRPRIRSQPALSNALHSFFIRTGKFFKKVFDPHKPRQPWVVA